MDKVNVGIRSPETLNFDGHFNYRDDVFVHDKKARAKLLKFIRKNDEDICWILGDSFMEFNLNYVQHYLNIYNKKAIFMSLGGSSVYYSYMRFLNIENDIKPYHTMLVGISSAQRHFFNHYHVHGFATVNTARKRKPTKRFMEAVQLYYEELFDFDENYNTTNAVVDSFKRRVEGRTKHTVFIPTLTKYEALDNEPPLYHTVMNKWYKSNHKGKRPPRTPNHWIDDREFTKTFLKHYNSKFENWKKEPI